MKKAIVDITQSQRTPSVRSLHSFVRSFACGFISLFAGIYLWEQKKKISKMKYVNSTYKSFLPDMHVKSISVTVSQSLEKSWTRFYWENINIKALIVIHM
jgi:hypothetical protein